MPNKVLAKRRTDPSGYRRLRRRATATTAGILFSSAYGDCRREPKFGQQGCFLDFIPELGGGLFIERDLDDIGDVPSLLPPRMMLRMNLFELLHVGVRVNLRRNDTFVS